MLKKIIPPELKKLKIMFAKSIYILNIVKY